MTDRERSLIITVILAACAAIFAGLFFYNQFVSIPDKNYKEAVSFYEMHNYEAAQAKFEALGSYRDSAVYLEKISKESTYDKAVKAFESGDYAAAKELFSQISDFSDSKNYLEKIEEVQTYEQAKAAFEEADYDAAESAFSQIDEYSDSEEYMRMINDEHIYAEACALYENQEYKAARELFATIPGYSDVNDIVARMDADAEYNNYIGHLTEFGRSAADVEQLGCDLIDETTVIWNNCVNKVSSDETDRYTKNSYGEFHEDPNTALTVYYWGDEYAQTRDSITNGRILADGQFELLKNSSVNLSDCVVKAFAVQDAYSDLIDLSMDMRGDFDAHADEAKEKESAFDAAYGEFIASIPEKMRIDAPAAAETEAETETGLTFAGTEAETTPAAAETEAETAPAPAGTEAETEARTSLTFAGTEAETMPAVAETEAETAPAPAGTEAETIPVTAETEAETETEAASETAGFDLPNVPGINGKDPGDLFKPKWAGVPLPDNGYY